MVWIHGGGYYQGSGALPISDGAALARKGAVVVTVNYRLGRLGFMAHPELSAESEHQVSGNYGWLDIICALEWVQRNIAAFGGDPDCVTLFGQSVGAYTVNAFMTSPLTKGLFHRAIGQSGGVLAPPGRFGQGSMLFLDAAEKAGQEFGKGLGATSIDELRARSAAEIQLVRPEAGWIIKPVFDVSEPGPVERETAWAIIDGHILPEAPGAVFERGDQLNVPLLGGSTANEAAGFSGAASMVAYIASVKRDYGDFADTFLRLYPAANDAEAWDMAKVARGDQVFVSQNWMWARLHARTQRAKTFLYSFSRVPPAPELAKLGAFHTIEIPYVFQTFDAYRQWPWQPWDHELSGVMSSYWVNFARNGDPNGAGLPSWPAFDPETDTTLTFADDISAGPVAQRDRLAFWDMLRVKGFLPGR